MAGFNGIAWFEIGTDDPSAAEKFYGAKPCRSPYPMRSTRLAGQSGSR
jgi:hypothetical protein